MAARTLSKQEPQIPIPFPPFVPFPFPRSQFLSRVFFCFEIVFCVLYFCFCLGFFLFLFGVLFLFWVSSADNESKRERQEERKEKIPSSRHQKPEVKTKNGREEKNKSRSVLAMTRSQEKTELVGFFFSFLISSQSVILAPHKPPFSENTRTQTTHTTQQLPIRKRVVSVRSGRRKIA